MGRNSMAICPECGDELDIVQKQLKPHENWTYYCFGCNMYFQLNDNQRYELLERALIKVFEENNLSYGDDETTIDLPAKERVERYLEQLKKEE